MVSQSKNWYSWRISLAFLVLIWLSAGTYVLASTAIPPILTGIEELQTGQAQLLHNPSAAATSFQAASQRFTQAGDNLQQLPFWVKILTPLPPFRWSVRLVKASYALAEAGKSGSQLASSFPNLIDKPTGETSTSDSKISSLLTSASSRYFNWYGQHQNDLDTLDSQLSSANNQLSGIPSWIFLTKKSQLEQLKTQVDSLQHGVKLTQDFSSQLNQAFGASDANPHTWLLLFQNNAELRPTGGFIGSFASLTASGGTVRQFQFGQNIYKLDATIAQNNPQLPPLPLRTISHYWGFRESNSGVGFLTEAAPQIVTEYQTATNTKPEGLILLDASVLADLLRLTGPVELPNRPGVTITADSLYQTLAQEIEQTYYDNPANWAINEPKQVLADLMPVLVDRVEKLPNLSHQLPPVLEGIIERKSLQLWSSQTTLNRLFLKNLPSDLPATGNWLKVVNSNVGGQKSSINVWQTVQINQQIGLFSNQIKQTITITRQHKGNGVWPDFINYNYLDIYLPAEATITELPKNIGGKNFLSEDEQKRLGVFNKDWQTEVVQTDQYKKVSLWATTEPGKQTSYTLTYTLPLNNQNRNQFTYLKQAGAVHEQFQGFGVNTEVNGNLMIAGGL